MFRDWRRALPFSLIFAVPFGLFAQTACQSNAVDDEDGSGGTGGRAPKPTGGAGGAEDGEGGAKSDGGDGPGAKPLYAMMSNIYLDQDRVVLVKVFESLDVTELSLDDAREFPGVANFDAIGGRLLVSSGDEPLITAYDIDEGLVWHKVKDVGFHGYSLFDNANFFYQYLVDDHHMYMPYDVVKRIVWDPTDLKILGTEEDSVLEIERGNLVLEQGGNRSGIRYIDRPSLVPFFYHDEDWYDFGDESFIVAYDPKTHEESKVIEAPCAGLAIASLDEEGNAYFSTYDYGPVRPLSGQGPNPCVVRVTPGLELDEEFTTDLTDLTGGRLVSNFRYVRDGWGLANVFHDERSSVDFRSEVIDPAAFDEAWAEENWSVWRFDLKNRTAEPFDDIELPSFGWTPSEIDGRSFISVPYSEGGRTKFYELNDAGEMREHLDVVGDAGWIRVR